MTCCQDTSYSRETGKQTETASLDWILLMNEQVTSMGDGIVCFKVASHTVTFESSVLAVSAFILCFRNSVLL